MKIKKDTNFIILIVSAFTTTLIITPNINKDSMVIPKLILILISALYFLPVIIRSLSSLREFKYIRQLFYLSSIYLIFSVLIILNSESPIEQLLYGRSGRGLGFLTFLSSIILMLSASVSINFYNLRLLSLGLSISGITTCIYAICQFFGIDFFNWDTKTNGIIGTLGNPNFQSSFAAMVFWPIIIFLWRHKNKYINILLATILIFATIFVSNSTQGYIGILTVILVFSLLFFWYRKKIIFLILVFFALPLGVVSIIGMLGHGPLSNYLYKVSVQSRGDFWRSAFATGNSNPIFGVGFDSFGDYFLIHRDSTAASHSFAEYTDSAHNYFLDYLVTGGYFFLFINLLLVFFVFKSFYIIQKRLNNLNLDLAAIFCAWLVFQMQSIISPIGIAFIMWNSIISGSVIGISSLISTNQKVSLISRFRLKFKAIQTLLVVLGLIIMFPYFNSDRMQLKAMQTGNGDLLIRAVTSYPESVLKYSQAGRDLLNSGLAEPSLFIARKAVDFNPNSAALWALILANPIASIDEKNNAKFRILELDPLNSKVQALEFK